MPRILCGLFFLLFFLLRPLIAIPAEPVISLNQLIEEALAVNPQIGAARHRAEAARQQIPQAGALDDPMLGFGVLNLPDSFDFNVEPMTTKEISLSQKVPFFGKRRLMREVAERQAEASQSEIDENANQVIKDVKLVFYDLAHVYRATDVTLRNKAILEDFSRLTQTRYGLGQGIQEDVIRAQVEISRMLDELLMLEQRRRALEARMNMLLNRPTSHPLGVPEEVLFEPRNLDIEQLQQTALDTSPVLKALQNEVSAGVKGLSLANRERYPDFNFRVSYGQRDIDSELYSGMIEMNLPVFAKSKQNRKVDEAAARLSARQAEYTGARNEIFFAISDAATMAQRLQKQYELYRTGIIPQTTVQIQSAMSAYTVNKADFMTLLDSRMRLYRFELDFHQALTDYAKSIAVLEAAVGTPLVLGKEQE
ncbi:MAG: TolC family protein [Deltaproteobacteria bacterium]|nr:TolC family protein [Deltaproteobacteria bacterium]